MTDALPIDDVLPELLDALRAKGRAVLQAPPGAGKTTRVPLAVLAAGIVQGRILMLEPRRLAARAAPKAGSRMPISSAMMLMTTSSSIRVKPAARPRRGPG